MRRFILLTILLLVAEVSFSQTDFREGFVIKQNGDTLFGFVDYREGAKAYRACDFKTTREGTAATYQPADVAGYGFRNDKLFLSKEVSMEDESTRVVFTEVIVKSLVSLYKFETSYFVEKQDKGLQQLRNYAEETIVNGQVVVRNSNEYVGTLNMNLFDCPEIRKRISKVTLTEKDLTKLVEAYNQCKGQAAVSFKSAKPWTKVVTGLTGGVTSSTLHFDQAIGFEHLAGKFDVATSPIIGVSVGLLFPRLSERISFHADVLYLNSKYARFSVVKTGPYVMRNDVTIELQQMKIPIAFRYTLPERNLTPYFNLGLSHTIHLSSDSHWQLEADTGASVETFQNKALFIRDSHLGVWGGFGTLKSISNKLNGFIELRYERTNGIDPIPIDPQETKKSHAVNYHLLVGIRMK